MEILILIEQHSNCRLSFAASQVTWCFYLFSTLDKFIFSWLWYCYHLYVLLLCKLQIISDDHIIIKRIIKCTEMKRTSSHQQKTIYCLIAVPSYINIFTYFECSIFFFFLWSKLDTRNKVKTSDYLYLNKEIDLPTFDNVGARCRTKEQKETILNIPGWNLLCSL